MTAPFATLAVLQATRPGTGMIYIVQIAAILGIMYFLMIMPQQKQRKKHEEALRQLKKGDEIVTAGGILGRVVHIRESSKDGNGKPLEDAVTIQSGESRLIVERGRIARIGTTSTAPASAKQLDG
jgi:preprotein translocase subunit YajC